MAVIRHEVILDDKVSKPAKSAADSVSGLAKSFQGAADACRVGQEVIGAAMQGVRQAVLSLAAGDVQGAVASIGEGLAGAAKALDLLVPGLGQVTSALISVQFAALGVAIGGAKLAIEASHAKLAMIGMFDALGQGVTTGEQVDEMLDELRASIGMTKGAMAPFVKSFMAMGVTGTEELKRLTTAAMSAHAIMGDPSAAKAFEALTKKIQIAAQTGEGLKIPLKGLGSLADMGLTVADVAKQMNVSVEDLTQGLQKGTVNATKFGDAMTKALIEKGAGPLERMSGGIGNLWALLKENLVDMFEDMGPAIEPFLAAVKDLFGIFDSKTKPSGQALKSAIEGSLKAVFEIGTKVVPMIKHFLLDMIILGLKAYIALKPIIGWFKQLAENQTVMTILEKAFQGLKVVAIAVAVVIGIVLAVMFGLWAIGLACSVAMYALIGSIYELVTGAGKALIEWASSAYDAASNFVQGLVNGIQNGAGMVMDAVRGLGNSAISTLKSTLGIASPSKIAFQMGANTGEGFAGGMDASTGAVDTSAGNMAGAAMGGMSSGSSSGTTSPAKGGGVVSAVFEAGSIVIQGAGKAAEEITEEMMGLALERMAAEAGL